MQSAEVQGRTCEAVLGMLRPCLVSKAASQQLVVTTANLNIPFQYGVQTLLVQGSSLEEQVVHQMILCFSDLCVRLVWLNQVAQGCGYLRGGSNAQMTSAPS
jgi:hypothetical protein